MYPLCSYAILLHQTCFIPNFKKNHEELVPSELTFISIVFLRNPSRNTTDRYIITVASITSRVMIRTGYAIINFQCYIYSGVLRNNHWVLPYTYIGKSSILYTLHIYIVFCFLYELYCYYSLYIYLMNVFIVTDIWLSCCNIHLISVTALAI